MAKRPDLTDITSLDGFATTHNENNTEIEEAFDNTLSRDGSSPNQMGADLDMNSNDVLNVNSLATVSLSVNGTNLVSSTVVPAWRGPWATSTVYGINNIVQESSNSYISVEEHTSGVFATDLAAGKWELMAAKGAGDITSNETVTGVWTFSADDEEAIVIEHPSSTAAITFNKGASGRINRIRGQLNTLDRWALDLGDSTAESGSDTGSDFTLKSFDDAGVLKEDALKVRRDNSNLELGGDIQFLDTANGVFYQAGSGGFIRDLAGSGTPEGNVAAPVGSTYRRSDGGAGTSFYVKESGSGNTGWVGK